MWRGMLVAVSLTCWTLPVQAAQFLEKVVCPSTKCMGYHGWLFRYYFTAPNGVSRYSQVMIRQGVEASSDDEALAFARRAIAKEEAVWLAMKPKATLPTR